MYSIFLNKHVLSLDFKSLNDACVENLRQWILGEKYIVQLNISLPLHKFSMHALTTRPSLSKGVRYCVYILGNSKISNN